MPRPQLLSKAYPVRLSKRCERAWIYLQKCKLKPGRYLRAGGEKAVIDKANEFRHTKKREKRYSGALVGLFDD